MDKHRLACHNRFDITVRRADGSVRARAEAYNCICDTLWEQLASDISESPFNPGGRYFRYILFGSGSGTPSSGDTALFSQEGYRGVATDGYTLVYDEETHTASVSASVILRTGEETGTVITEVGIGYDSEHCVTHAMLCDMDGSPMPITVADEDETEIRATVYLRFDLRSERYGFRVDGWNMNGEQAGGLAAWLCGACGVLTPFSTRLFPCRYLYASRDVVPDSITSAGPDTDARFQAAHSASFDPESRRLSVSFRVPPEKFNFAGGIRYLALYSVVSSGRDGLTLCPSFLIFYDDDTCAEEHITGEAVGTGDGTETEFSLQFDCTADTPVTVYLDGTIYGECSVQGRTILFPEPPPEGASITADYTTYTLQKDAHHIYELTVGFDLSEPMPE